MMEPEAFVQPHGRFVGRHDPGVGPVHVLGRERGEQGRVQERADTAPPASGATYTVTSTEVSYAGFTRKALDVAYPRIAGESVSVATIRRCRPSSGWESNHGRRSSGVKATVSNVTGVSRT